MKVTDVVILIMSVGAILIGCFGKTFNYATGRTWSASGKPAPTWLGRLMFIGVGVLFLVPELVHLFSDGN
jgi:hypothetical protein